MLTTKLEELIWKGKAQYKTFIAGGGQKSVLKIPDQHFVIITDITYFSSMFSEETKEGRLNGLSLQKNLNTQINIFSTKNFNRFIFRNFLTQISEAESNINTPFGSTHHDVYLIHQDKGISFTFSLCPAFDTDIDGIAAAATTSLRTPLDYGNTGDPNSIFVAGELGYTAGNWIQQPCETTVNTVPNTVELAFPVTGATNIPKQIRVGSFAYPILQVQYVLIKGIPTDLGFN